MLSKTKLNCFTHFLKDSKSSNANQELDKAFSFSMPSPAMSFSLFEDERWHNFFQKLLSNWTSPKPAVLGCSLLNQTFETKTSETFDTLHKANGPTIGIDVATKVLSNSVSNGFRDSPPPSFSPVLRIRPKTRNCPYHLSLTQKFRTQ